MIVFKAKGQPVVLFVHKARTGSASKDLDLHGGGNTEANQFTALALLMFFQGPRANQVVQSEVTSQSSAIFCH